MSESKARVKERRRGRGRRQRRRRRKGVMTVLQVRRESNFPRQILKCAPEPGKARRCDTWRNELPPPRSALLARAFDASSSPRTFATFLSHSALFAKVYARELRPRETSEMQRRTEIFTLELVVSGNLGRSPLFPGEFTTRVNLLH